MLRYVDKCLLQEAVRRTDIVEGMEVRLNRETHGMGEVTGRIGENGTQKEQCSIAKEAEVRCGEEER